MGSKHIWLIIVTAFSVGVFLSGALIFESGPSSISPGTHRADVAKVNTIEGGCC
jgi:hypothetical protein